MPTLPHQPIWNIHPRLRGLFQVGLSIGLLIVLPGIAMRAAHGLTQGVWMWPLGYAMLLFLYLLLFSGMGRGIEGQQHPLREMGLARREGWAEELAVGGALGWGMVAAMAVLIALVGGLRIGFDPGSASWGALARNTVTLLLAALVEEVSFRGYPFQRLIQATGPTLAVVLSSVAFGVMHAFNPGATLQSVLVTMLSGVLFCLAYLRTRALWVGWGVHFAWNFALGTLFGLPVSGLDNFATVIESRARGPLWLTGGEYGPEASLPGVLVLFAGLLVLVAVTRGYAWRYSHREIVGAGIPVDLGPHPAMPGLAPAAVAPEKPRDESGLVQIELK